MALSDNLKKIREERKLTKKELCKKTGISERAYLTYEFGEREPKISVICKLADFYGVTVDYLLGREEEKKPDMLTQLAQEFNLTEIEKVLVQAYITISPKERKKFIKTIEEVVSQKETAQQVILQPDIQISKRAIARSKDNPFRDAPTPEQIASFTPVPEDSDL